MAIPQNFRFLDRKDEDDDTILIIVNASGRILEYEGSPHPTECRQRRMAWGSGADVALSAMAMGKTAKEAVRASCAVYNDCGLGVDVLTLKP